MADQVHVNAEPRVEHGKGPSKRLRKTGRVPAILYGSDIGSQACHVDALEMYHALHTSAGANVLIRLHLAGEEHLSIIREVQRHALRGDLVHIDFQNVDRNQLIPAEIPVHLENEDSPREAGGVVNLVLYTVPIQVKPMDIPDAFTLDLDGLEIGDVVRVEDLADQLPDDASFDIEEERTVVTINAPISEEALEALEGGPEDELAEGEELEAAEGEGDELDAAAAEAATEDEGGEDDES